MKRESTSHTKVKLEERIKDDINTLLRKDFKDPRLLFVSVTKVELNKDNSVAKVFWDTFDSTKRLEIEKAFEGVVGKMRSKLAFALKIRHTPEIKFFYDSQFEDEKKIMDLIQQDSEK